MDNDVVSGFCGCEVSGLGNGTTVVGSEAAGVGSWVTPGFLRMGLSMLSAAAVDGQGPRRGQQADHCAYLRGGDDRGREGAGGGRGS
jgi:hypothetical protein